MKSVYVKDREFYKDITMKWNSRKEYIHVVRETSTNEIFAILGNTESETDSNIENLLENSDMEYIADEPIPKIRKRAINF